MKRYAVYLSVFAALFAVWVGLLALVQQSVIDAAKWGLVVRALPLILLVCLGFYCAGKLAYDLLTFKDYPNEIPALEKDIAEAKADLAKRKFQSK